MFEGCSEGLVVFADSLRDLCGSGFVMEADENRQEHSRLVGEVGHSGFEVGVLFIERDVLGHG